MYVIREGGCLRRLCEAGIRVREPVSRGSYRTPHWLRFVTQSPFGQPHSGLAALLVPAAADSKYHLYSCATGGPYPLSAWSESSFREHNIRISSIQSMQKGRGKKRRGPPAFAAKAKLPRYASHQAKLQSDKNEAREPKTMSTIRYGFRLAWDHAPKQMKNAKVKKVGEYDPHNHHEGCCFG